MVDFDYPVPVEALQIFVIKRPDGKFVVVKHIMAKSTVKGSLLAALGRGQLKAIDFGTSPGEKKHAFKAFQYMLERLGGFQCRRFRLSAEKKERINVKQ